MASSANVVTSPRRSITVSGGASRTLASTPSGISCRPLQTRGARPAVRRLPSGVEPDDHAHDVAGAGGGVFDLVDQRPDQEHAPAARAGEASESVLQAR